MSDNIFQLDPNGTATREWMLRNIKRTLVYRDASIDVEVSASIHSSRDISMMVSVTPKTSCCDSSFPHSTRSQTIRFLTRYESGFNQGSGKITFQDLLGNGGSVRGKGYGTLCVNLALQAWDVILTKSQKDNTLIEGRVVPSGNEKKDAAVAVRFWESFGLLVAEKHTDVPIIDTPFSQWKFVDRNERSEVNTQLSLADFWPSYESGELMPCDEKNYQRITQDIDRMINMTYVTEAEVEEVRRSTEMKRRLSPVGIGSSIGIIVYLIIAESISLSWSEMFLFFLSILASGAVIGGIAGLFSPVKQLFTHVVSEELRQILFDREHCLDEYHKALKPLGQNDRGFLCRVVVAFGSKEFIAQLSRQQQDIVSRSKYYDLELSEYAMVYMLSILHQLEHHRKAIEKVDDEAKPTHDFLFGSISYLSIDDLNTKANELTDQFEFHLNRLLSSAPNNYLQCHSGASYTRIAPLLTQLQNIARVEIYASDRGLGSCSTIGIKLYLQSGILDLKACWTGYKSIRLDEVMEVALDLELLASSLVGKTFAMFGKQQEAYKSTEELMVAIVDLLGEQSYCEKYIRNTVATLRDRRAEYGQRV